MNGFRTGQITGYDINGAGIAPEARYPGNYRFFLSAGREQSLQVLVVGIWPVSEQDVRQDFKLGTAHELTVDEHSSVLVSGVGEPITDPELLAWLTDRVREHGPLKSGEGTSHRLPSGTRT